MLLTYNEVNVVKNSLVKIYCGEGKGKSTASLGRALVCASEGKDVFMIQFLKGRHTGTLDYLKRLEPEVKVFRFEKMNHYYDELSETEQQEENINILNGMNFAKKVLTIGECDVLILDEVLGLVDLGIIHVSDIIRLIHTKPEEMELILTGRNLPPELVEEADYISQINIVKNDETEV